VISLFVAAAAGSLLPSPTKIYIEEARQAIVEAVGVAEQNKKITDFFPQKLLGYFDRFGRNLADGEAIELQDTPSRAPGSS
jgi:3D (Asp-Asp-Asp) domain-containing protein